MAVITKNNNDRILLSYENEYEKMAFGEEALDSPSIRANVTSLANEFKELFGIGSADSTAIKRVLDSIMVDGKNYNILRPGEWSNDEAAMACAMSRIKKLAVYERNPKSSDGVHHIVYRSADDNFLSVGNGIEDIVIPPKPEKPRWRLFGNNQAEIDKYEHNMMIYNNTVKAKKNLDLIKSNDEKYIKIAQDEAKSVAQTNTRTGMNTVNTVDLHYLMSNSETYKDSLMQRLKKANSFTRRNSKEYDNFLKALDSVNKLWDEQDNDEKKRKMLSAYENLEKACKEYLETHSTKRRTTMGEERVNIVRDVLNLQRKEKKQVQESWNREHAADGKYILGDHAEKARYVELNEKDFKINNIGANTSKRLYIQGKDINGIFTEEKADKNAGFEGVVMRCARNAKDIPERIINQIYTHSQGATKVFDVTLVKDKKSAFKFLINSGIMKDTTEDKALWDSFAENLGNRLDNASKNGYITTGKAMNILGQVIEAYAPEGHKDTLKNYKRSMDFYGNLGRVTKPVEEKLKFLKDNGICTEDDIKSGSKTRKALEQFLQDMSIETASQANSKLANIQLEKRTELNSRNIATSVLAELIGCPEIVAKTEKATVVSPDGTTKEGVLMEYVSGNGASTLNLPIDSKIAMANRPNGELKKNIADLQVLDILCGQIDRHMNNVMFQTDKEGFVTGFKAIDNDMSFGLAHLNNSGYHSINLNMITHIDKTTANNINNLDKEVLEYKLKDLLAKEEIDALWKRVSVMKEWINERATLVPSNEWKDKSWDELAKGTYIAREQNGTSEVSLQRDEKNTNLFFKMGDLMILPNKFPARIIRTNEDKAALKNQTKSVNQFENDARKALKAREQSAPEISGNGGRGMG